jgi:hypothetical protein
VSTRKGAPARTPSRNTTPTTVQVPSEGTALLRHLHVLRDVASDLLAEGDLASAERLNRLVEERPGHVASVLLADAVIFGSAAAYWNRRRRAARRLVALKPGGDLAAHDPWVGGAA